MGTDPRAKNATANNEHGNTSSMMWKGIHDQDLLTDVGGVVSAGDGEVDDVLVGGGEQGDDEQAKHQQHPSQAGAWLVAHASKQLRREFCPCCPYWQAAQEAMLPMLPILASSSGEAIHLILTLACMTK